MSFKNMTIKTQTKKLDSIHSFLRQELGNLIKDFTHIESVGQNYRAVLKNGHRVMVITNHGHDKNLAQVAANMEIWRSQTPVRAKWVVPMVFWEYVTPRVLVIQESVHQSLTDNSISKKYLARYLLSWFVHQFGVLGHFFIQPKLDDFFVLPGNRISSYNFLETGFLAPIERKIFINLLEFFLKNDVQSAIKIILDQHYKQHTSKHFKPAAWHFFVNKNSSIAEQMERMFFNIKESGIDIPDSLFVAAKSLQALEKIISILDKEVDINSGLLSLIQRQ